MVDMSEYIEVELKEAETKEETIPVNEDMVCLWNSQFVQLFPSLSDLIAWRIHDMVDSIYGDKAWEKWVPIDAPKEFYDIL